MPIVKDILLQLLFITLPILLYKNVWLERYHPRVPERHRYLVALFSSVTVILCMTFPIQVDNGLQYDLRSIPLITTILYGGYGPGIITALVMFAYRCYLGGDGFYVTTVVYTLYAIIPFLLVNKWYKYRRTKKIVAIIGLGFIEQFSSAIGVIIVILLQGSDMVVALGRLQSMVFVAIVHILAMGLVVYLAEFVRETAYIRSQIHRSEKLNLISELAASVAHEVRNPLTVVRGFVQLLREDSNPKNKEYIHLMLTELDRAEFIISDYLNLAKPQAGVTDKFDVSETAHEVIEIMSSFALMNGVHIQLLTDRELFVRGEKVKIKQALMNLLKNGIEAMNDNEGVIKVSVVKSGPNIVVCIRDQGEGMTNEQIENLGLPFYSTKEKGTGLGLMVTFRIIESMGGSLEFESDRGKGTTATIRIPALTE